MTPPGVLPPAPAVGANPRLIDKLEKAGTEAISDETWSLFEEAASDEDAQHDVRAMLTNPTSHVYSLWMNPKTPEVALGHSTFVYIAKKGKDDPFHRCGVVFINDRSDRGDPIPYAVEKPDFKKWGGWKQVTAVKTDSDRTTFFADEDNIGKLFSPAPGQETEPKNTPRVMIAGTKVATYVLEERPSAGQLEQWADTNLVGKERDAVATWAELASQTSQNNSSTRPSSILAHDLEPILNPSPELNNTLKVQLETSLGKAEAVPPVTLFQGGSETPGGQDRQKSIDESWDKLAAAVTDSKTPKSKLTKELKETLAGYWGSPWEATRNKETRTRWEELDKKKGNQHSLMKTAMGHLKEVAQELRINPRGQLITHAMLIEMLTVDH